jgi:hypothetical protein
MMLPSKSKRRDPSQPSLPSHRLEFQRVRRDRRSSVSRHRLPFMRHGGIFRDASAVAVTEGVTRNSSRPSLWNARKIRNISNMADAVTNATAIVAYSWRGDEPCRSVALRLDR